MGGKNSRPNSSKEKDLKTASAEPTGGQENEATGYTEIKEEFLEQNRKNFKQNLNDKLSSGHSTPTAASPEEILKSNGVPGRRIHPYDDIEMDNDEPNLTKVVSVSKSDISKNISEDGVALPEIPDEAKAEGKKMKDKKRKAKKEKKEKKNSKGEAQLEEKEKTVHEEIEKDSESVYSNVTAIKAQEGEELYAKPMKFQKNALQVTTVKELNYIEVVVSPKTSKPELKQMTSNSTTYSNVIAKEDGKIVLVTDPA